MFDMNKIEIVIFEPMNFSTKDWEVFHEFKNKLKAEMFPEQNLTDLKETLAEFQTVIPLHESFYWIAKSTIDSSIVGFAKVRMTTEGENMHTGWFEVLVLPELRNKGLGKKLAQKVIDLAKSKGKSLLMVTTVGTVPVAENFVKSLGANLGSSMSISQLDLMGDLDRNLAIKWSELLLGGQEDFKVGLWIGAYPKDELNRMIALKDAMNSAPRDGLQVNDSHWTVDQLLQIEEFQASRSIERWTVYVEDTKSKRLVAFTESLWHSSEKEVVHQGDTVVLPEFRNKGIGRWIKGTMLQKILTDRPYAKYIRVSNADTNESMLNINKELGFKCYQSRKAWQIKL